MTDTPIVWVVGKGYRPAHMPADYIGPRMDCPMWIIAPDADLPLIGKLDPWAVAPATGYAWGTWIPQPNAQQIIAASLTGVSTPSSTPPWHPITPTQPWWPSQPSYPCRCIETPPDVPPIAPVPLPASGVLLAVAVLALMMRGRGWR